MTKNNVSYKYYGNINGIFGQSTFRTMQDEDKLFSNILTQATIHNQQNNKQINKSLKLPKTFTYPQNTKSNSDILFPGRYNPKYYSLEEYIEKNQEKKGKKIPKKLFFGKKCDNKVLHNNILIPLYKERLIKSKPKYLRSQDNSLELNINKISLFKS